ncbi:MAG: DUF4190 domain-containing protein [Planctomycetes bacterium]|nr:DUF4190 domain-containing protein [Planctomycetota bacterium]
MQPHRGTMILVFGIMSLIVCMPLGIIAWVMANGDLKKMNAGEMDPEGRGNTQAGKICGIISVCLALVGFVIWFLLVVLFAGGAIIVNS